MVHDGSARGGRPTSAGRGRQRHRKMAVGLSALALLGVAACGNGSGGGSGKDTGTSKGAAIPAPGTPEALKLTGTVNYWSWGTQSFYQKVVFDPFNKAYPNVKINFKQLDFSTYPTVLRPALIAGQAIDVFDVTTGALFNQFKQFASDVTPLAQKVLGDDWKSKLGPGGVSGFTRDGKLLAASLGSGGAGYIMLNKTMLDQYGLQAPTTLDNWKQTCSVLKSKGKSCVVIGAKDAWVNTDVYHAISYSISPGKFTDAVEGKVAWTDPDLVQALGIWKQFFTDGLVQPGALGIIQYQDAYNLWEKGTGAISPVGSWQASDMLKATQIASQKAAGVSNPKPFVATLVPFPDVAGKGNAVPPFADATGQVIFTKAKNRLAAETFVSFMDMTKEGQQPIANSLLAAPALLSVTPHLEGLIEPTVQQANLAEVSKAVQQATEPRSVPYPDLVTALGNALQAVAAGQQTPEAAAASIEKVSKTVKR
jgi:raffinose/stachyose/melibiose transport system substrate-binding protein